MDEKTDSDNKLVSLVVPFYNESESIKQFYDAIMSVFGSLQLVRIGVLSECVGRLYMENKQRPIYLIRGYYESGN